ncbi:MAG TPA: ATP synthase F1 subunit delta [Candidatus Acidoferrales bacterium]
MSTLADRYAAALADVAVAQKEAEQVRRELADFIALLHESPQLGVLLGNPAVARAAKHRVLETLVARLGASKTLRNFLFVVLDRKRIELLQEVQQAFDAQLDDRQGITRVNVTSARELNDTEKTELRGALEHISGRRVEAQYQLDPALIAGTVVRVGSTIYDGSVRTQLERLRARLASQ